MMDYLKRTCQRPKGAKLPFALLKLLLFFNILCALSSRMDPALLRERELFKKRALSTPAVEKRHAASDSGSHKKKKPRVDKESSSGSKHSAGKRKRFFLTVLQSLKENCNGSSDDATESERNILMIVI